MMDCSTSEARYIATWAGGRSLPEHTATAASSSKPPVNTEAWQDCSGPLRQQCLGLRGGDPLRCERCALLRERERRYPHPGLARHAQALAAGGQNGGRRARGRFRSLRALRVLVPTYHVGSHASNCPVTRTYRERQESGPSIQLSCFSRSRNVASAVISVVPAASATAT